MKDKVILRLGLGGQHAGIAEAVVIVELGIGGPFGGERRIGHHCVKLTVAELVFLQRVAVLNVKIAVLDSVQEHIHSGQVKRRGVLFLAENFVRITASGRAEQERATTAGRIVHIFETGLAGNHNLRENLAHLLRRIELSGFLTGSGGELTNHIFIGISENVYVLRIVQPEINAVERYQYIADKPVFVISGLAQFRGGQVNIGEQTAEIIHTLVPDGTVFYLLEATLQLRKDILFVGDAFNNGRVQEFRFNEIPEVIHTDLPDFAFEFFLIRRPRLLECEPVLAQLVIEVQFNFLGQVLIENESQGEIHKVPCGHISSQFVGYIPKLGAQSLL